MTLATREGGSRGRASDGLGISQSEDCWHQVMLSKGMVELGCGGGRLRKAAPTLQAGPEPSQAGFCPNKGSGIPSHSSGSYVSVCKLD